jgi:hypothetical protein
MGVGTYVTAVVIKDKIVKRIGVVATAILVLYINQFPYYGIADEYAFLGE